MSNETRPNEVSRRQFLKVTGAAAAVAGGAGLGEHGRHGVIITPELGSNMRPAVVTTNIPMKTDKPIEFGVQDFCKLCKICAENCPSGAITFGDKVEVRGYLRYRINLASPCGLPRIGCRPDGANAPDAHRDAEVPVSRAGFKGLLFRTAPESFR